jgi:hypothetical protein
MKLLTDEDNDDDDNDDDDAVQVRRKEINKHSEDRKLERKEKWG